MGLCLREEMSHPHSTLSQAHGGVEEDEMTETLGNVLIFWRKWQSFLTFVDSYLDNGPVSLP